MDENEKEGLELEDIEPSFFEKFMMNMEWVKEKREITALLKKFNSHLKLSFVHEVITRQQVEDEELRILAIRLGNRVCRLLHMLSYNNYDEGGPRVVVEKELELVFEAYSMLQHRFQAKCELSDSRGE